MGWCAGLTLPVWCRSAAASMAAGAGLGRRPTERDMHLKELILMPE